LSKGNAVHNMHKCSYLLEFAAASSGLTMRQRAVSSSFLVDSASHAATTAAAALNPHCKTANNTTAAQIYTQLTSVMSKVFFPGSDPAVQALSIWGIFAGTFMNMKMKQMN
jgi:hypothetical protein